MNRKIIPVISCCSFLILNFITVLNYAQESNDSFNLLKQNITDVTIKDVNYIQYFQGKNEPCIVSFKIVNTKNEKEEEYECNLSDLDEKKVELNATKQSLNVECVTRKNKDLVRVYENDKIKEYTNKFIFYATDVEKGKLIVRELHNLIK